MHTQSLTENRNVISRKIVSGLHRIPCRLYHTTDFVSRLPRTFSNFEYIQCNQNKTVVFTSLIF